MGLKKRVKNVLSDIRIHTIQPLLRRAGGWEEMQTQLDSVYYILNNGMPIGEFPKATGILRKVQLADTELLRIFHEVCEKHGLRYWLDYGTLLGAVRHKGFIPWDDDLDCSMLREDYERAHSILSEEMPKYGFEVGKDFEKRIWISNWKAGVMLDVFPFDSINKSYFDDKEDLKKRAIKYRKYYVKNEKKKPPDQLKTIKEQIIGPASGASEQCWIYPGPEFEITKQVIEYDMLFPLALMKFETYDLYVPANAGDYLESYYGDYMSYPKWGMLHHKAGGGGIHNNPIKYSFDIDGYLSKLKDTHIE